MRKQFTDKVALVTGAGTGIGRASAQALAQVGARVIVADVAAEGGEETLRLIKDADGEATFVQTDVSKAVEVEELIRQTIRIYGHLDYAVNNAGIAGEEAGTISHSEEGWDRVLAINLKGVWLSMRYEIPEMLKQGGAIVNLSSFAGLRGSGGTVAYTASKHGVVGLTKAVALEFARQNIRVNALCPGFVHTPMLQRIFETHPGVQGQLAERSPVGRIAKPEEIAQAVIWLCSDASSFITGACLPVDGGLTAC
ncbi:SDR family oxidoreductase [Ktedonosporobacter rubrisoli]|uniref:SDR family oxidoreductase n=1 Tax=Ktedonosporobacter rubrisoli TaxID=2509675 RepID=A0A4P6JPZ3_KTERU|nr:SDR family oxidoreductase [Ktedonosporobacter rubrisoli]QBD77172.1 SDR family oxidoreductase [Ktedonosporobacter rubrisoli]